MNLFELFVKIGVDDQASGKLKDLGGKLGNGLKTAAKIGTAAVATAAAGIAAFDYMQPEEFQNILKENTIVLWDDGQGKERGI